VQIKQFITLSIILIPFLQAYSQDTAVENDKLSKQDLKTVTDFIKVIRDKNLDELGARISFPLARKYPVPEIKNKDEFLKRHDEVFDDSLTKMILISDPNKDWSAMGWRGIMLHDGMLWIDYDGKLLSVYQSKFEETEWEELVKKEKKDLYVSIRTFIQPICILETKKYRIRIDESSEGNYRYSAWPLKSKMSDKPEIVLENGERVFDGSGGNHYYKFKNSEYTYECWIIVMGEDSSPPALLEIYKGDKAILSQRAEIITK